MRLCSIASGSSGNCIYVGSDNTHILIDTGISKKRIDAGLKELEIKGEDLDGILITHEHSDHIQGLGVFSRKYEIPIYATPGTIAGIQAYSRLGAMPEGLYHMIHSDEAFQLGDIRVNPFAISHDANEPTGYRLECKDKSVAVATDLGIYDDAWNVRTNRWQWQQTLAFMMNIPYPTFRIWMRSSWKRTTIFTCWKWDRIHIL